MIYLTKTHPVFAKIGVALVSAQRVEFLAESLLEHLIEFDKSLYGLTAPDFFNSPKELNSNKKTLGKIFKLLKLQPNLDLGDELANYSNLRNTLVHDFATKFFLKESDNQLQKASSFCDDFIKSSGQVESFFKGFIYFISLKQVGDHDNLDQETKKWNKDFEYFNQSLKEKKLK